MHTMQIHCEGRCGGYLIVPVVPPGRGRFVKRQDVADAVVQLPTVEDHDVARVHFDIHPLSLIQRCCEAERKNVREDILGTNTTASGDSVSVFCGHGRRTSAPKE